MQKRKLFDELMQGLGDLAAEREGTKTPRPLAVNLKAAPEVTGAGDSVQSRCISVQISTDSGSPTRATPL